MKIYKTNRFKIQLHWIKKNQYSKKRRRWKWPECGNEHRQTRPSCNPIPLLYQDCTIKSKKCKHKYTNEFRSMNKKEKKKKKKKKKKERNGTNLWTRFSKVWRRNLEWDCNSIIASFFSFFLSLCVNLREWSKKTSLRDQNNVIECLLLLLLLTTLGLWRFSLLFSSTLVGNGSAWLHFYNWVGFAHIHS